MRSYLALDLSHLKISPGVFAKLKKSLAKKNWNYRFEKLDHLEIPLFGFKEMGREKINECLLKLHSANGLYSELELKLQGVWAYPQQSEARLLWIGVQQSRELSSFIGQLKILLKNFLPDDEDDRRAIVPLLRFRNHHHVADLISPYKTTNFGKISVHNFQLVELVSGGAFPQTKVLEKFPLSSQLRRQETFHEQASL